MVAEWLEWQWSAVAVERSGAQGRCSAVEVECSGQWGAVVVECSGIGVQRQCSSGGQGVHEADPWLVPGL